MGKITCLVLFIALTTVPAEAQQQYPSKPVRLLVGMVPGGATDTVGRLIAKLLSERFKHTFVVDNRPGANTLIAIQTLMNSAPDGYTLLVGTTGALTMSPLVEKNLPYNPLTSFTTVALMAAYPYILTVRRDLQVDDVKRLIEYSKNNTGKMSYGSAGNFSANHLGVEWLKNLTGIDAQHIPYKGGGAALMDLIAGRVDFELVTAGAAMPQIKAGKLKGLAVTSPARTRLAEGLPTMIESGVPGFVVQPWNGIIGPAHLPREIVIKLNSTINEELQRHDIQTRLAELSFIPSTDTPEAYQRLIAQELATWGDVVKRINVQQK